MHASCTTIITELACGAEKPEVGRGDSDPMDLESQPGVGDSHMSLETNYPVGADDSQLRVASSTKGLSPGTGNFACQIAQSESA